MKTPTWVNTTLGYGNGFGDGSGNGESIGYDHSFYDYINGIGNATLGRGRGEGTSDCVASNSFGSGYNNIELDMVTMATIERYKLRNKQELL